MTAPQVLSVGIDRRLLLARHALLEEAGFAVTSVDTTYEGLKTLATGRFAAVVVGQCFPFTEKQLFAAEVGERWRIPVIVLYKGNADFQLTADANVEITNGAAELITALNSVIFRQKRRSA
jgi:DNA-binding NtrC family response regulator